jgi:hypothetical protein
MKRIKKLFGIFLLALVATLSTPQAFAGAVETPGVNGQVTVEADGAVETPGLTVTVTADGAVETPGLAAVLIDLMASLL